MYKFNSQNGLITVYETAARDLTVIQGNSSVVYPFYKSSGKNSGIEGIWAPWMGYFKKHPEHDNQVYMTKPGVSSLSPAVTEVIKRNCTEKEAASLIARMGNDEALAISCSMGGGIWAERPAFRAELQSVDCLKPYLQAIEIGNTKKVPLVIGAEEERQLVDFKGKRYKGKVLGNQAIMAKTMEEITAHESARFCLSRTSTYLVQDNRSFPKTEQLARINTRSREAYKIVSVLESGDPAARIRVDYYHKLGLFEKEKSMSDKEKGKSQDIAAPSNKFQG
ncbi:hypothetical protein [Legionella gresilensis]|uniref:hypothetical protein n=1 Tax=Legionella gresilensis TaxID=91823 RepID=UPI001040FA82|nr:hypothetical protein [Legionella gresilensis]